VPLHAVSAIFVFNMLVPVAATPTDRANLTAWAKVRSDGLVAAKSSDYKRAEQLLTEAVQRATKFGDKDERLSATLDDLGNLYAMERKFDDARVVFLRVLKLSEDKYGTSDTALIGPLNNVVRVTCAGGKCSDTTTELKRLLQIKRSARGAYVQEIPVALLLLGEAYEQQRKYSIAVDYVNQAVAAQGQLTSAYSRQTIQLSLNLARIFQEMSKYDEAERICKEALQEEEKVCQSNDQLVVATLSRYKSILSATGRKDEAAKLSFVPRSPQKPH
jgi:tetratricopeptide (TPR) repeat protein